MFSTYETTTTTDDYEDFGGDYSGDDDITTTTTDSGDLTTYTITTTDGSTTSGTTTTTGTGEDYSTIDSTTTSDPYTNTTSPPTTVSEITSNTTGGDGGTDATTTGTTTASSTIGTSTEISTTAGPTQPFTVEIQVEIPLKVEFSEELANPESEEFQALEAEMYDFFNYLLADVLDSGFTLEIDIIVRPANRRKRRSVAASVEVNVRLLGELPIPDEDDETADEVMSAQIAATATVVAVDLTASISDEMMNYPGTFIDETAGDDIVVSEPDVTIEKEEINCLVDNGGCSHYCNNFEKRCECPTCWELGADGLTCNAESDKIELTCSADGFNVAVDQCVFTGRLAMHYPYDFNLEAAGSADSYDVLKNGVKVALNGSTEPECAGSYELTSQIDQFTFIFKLNLSGGLDKCGTQVHYGSNGELVFRKVFL